MPVTVFCDGLCEPVNPGGTACYGWVAYRNGEKLAEEWGVVCSGPEATNNVAEYAAVLRALEWLAEHGHTGEPVEVLSDSQLCMRQLSGVYRVRSERIRPLFEAVRGVARRFSRVRFRWIPRERNEEADALSRRAYAESVLSEAAASRARKARALATGVVALGGPRYRVPSQGTPGAWYLVDLEGPDCTCPDFRKRCRKLNLKCKHIVAAEMAAGRF